MLSIGLLAAAIGFIGALLGVGGGVFLVPAMVFGLNFAPEQAMPISLMCALATGVSGISFHALDNKIVRQALILEPAAIIGALFLTPVAYLVSAKQVMFLFALFILMVAVVSQWKMHHPPSFVLASELRRNLIGVLVAFLSGACSGALGIGGGIILVPLLGICCLIPTKEAVQISLFIMISTSVVGLLVHASMANMPWTLGIAGIAGALPAASLGAFVRTKLSDLTVNRLFLFFAATSSIAIIVKTCV